MEKTDRRPEGKKRGQSEEKKDEQMMNEQKKAERMTAQGVGPQSSMLLCCESKNVFRQDVDPGWDAVKHRKFSPFCCCRFFRCIRLILKEEAK